MLAAVCTEMTALANCTNLYLLVGNHDQFSRQGDVHSLEILRAQATIVDLQWITCIDSVSIAFQPHTDSIESLRSFSASLPPIDIYCFHQGVKEAVVGPLGIHAKAEACLADLPTQKARICLGGDYHGRQQVGSAMVFYVGSPLQTTMGERMEQKGFTILDTDTLSMEFIESRAPKFVYFETPGELFDSAQSEDDFITVVCKSQIEVDATLERFPHARIQLIEEDQQSATSRISAEVAQDDTQLLTAYITMTGISSLDQSRLLRLGLDFLKGDTDD